jgi:hypothetical protein
MKVEVSGNFDGEWYALTFDNNENFNLTALGIGRGRRRGQNKLNIIDFKKMMFEYMQVYIERIALLASEKRKGRTHAELEALWMDPDWPADYSADNIVACSHGDNVVKFPGPRNQD